MKPIHTHASVELVAKGPVKSTQRAAARYNVAVRNCREIGSSNVQCSATCDAESAIATWFSNRGRSKLGRGFAPGTLLHYSGQCGGRELGGLGSRRKRGKKRRK